MWGAALGAGINGITSMITAAQNNSYAKEAASRNYHYSIRSLKESPKAQRQGLEDAGYNPMLALGNIGGGSYSGSGQMGQMEAPDLVGGAKAASQMLQDVMKSYKLQNKKTEKEIENLESDLDTKETQRLQAEANTSLLNSQSERTDLAYGRDIADTLTSVAGTGAQLYSAKAMADVARQNARTNSRNASVNERKAVSSTVEVRRDSKGRKVGETLRTTRANGVPSVSSSSKGVKSNVVGGLGSSAKSVAPVVKSVGKALAPLMIAPVVDVLSRDAENRSRRIQDFDKRDSGKYNRRYWQPKRVLLH